MPKTNLSDTAPAAPTGRRNNKWQFDAGAFDAGVGDFVRNASSYRDPGGVNAQTGTTYTVAASDFDKLVTISNAAAVAVTLPQATTSGFGAGWYADVENRGAGVVTITPTTSTIDGAASLTLAKNQGCRIFSDGANYFTMRGRTSLEVDAGGAAIASRPKLNFVSGATAVDNPGTDSVDVTVTGSGSGSMKYFHLSSNGSSTGNDAGPYVANGAVVYPETNSVARAMFYNAALDFNNDWTIECWFGCTTGADGFAIVWQANGKFALGGAGGSFGYVGTTGNPNGWASTNLGGFTLSAALVHRIFNGGTINGDIATMTLGSAAGATYVAPAPVVITSNHLIKEVITFVAATKQLTYTLTDQVNANTYTNTVTLDIVAAMGTNLGYLGITQGCGGLNHKLQIYKLKFTDGGGTVQFDNLSGFIGGVDL